MSATEALDHTASDDPRWTLGNRFYKSRKAAKLTGEEMAAKLSVLLDRHISKQTVSNWENDVNQPRKLFEVVDAWASLCPDEFTSGWLLQSTCFAVSALPAGAFALEMFDEHGEPYWPAALAVV